MTTYCENEAANLIFSSFAGRAESCGVPLNIQAHIPQLISVAETDLCVLLSNALENALRACRRMKAENGPAYIEVTAREKNGHLFLQFVNPCPEGIQFENGLPVTHTEGHGIGVRSICKTLDIALADVMAFGDNYNDVSMLDIVGVPYIMDGAAAPLREKYPNHTPRPEDVLREFLKQA